ncbi:MAG: hypothetical protein AAGA93_12830 [Actinomycetota bacterium]
MTRDPARLYLWSGLLWYGALRAYWVSLVVRLTIQLELPSLQLVLLGTAMEAALLLAEVPTGVIADRFSRKWSIVIGFLGVGGAQIAAGVVETFPLLVASQIVWGIAFTFRSGADTAWVTDELGGPDEAEGLILRLARRQQVVAIGAIAGGAVLGRLTSLTTSVVVTGLLLIGAGLLLAVVMPETGFPRPAATTSEIGDGAMSDAGPSDAADGGAGAGRGGTIGGGLVIATRGLASTLSAGARATLGSRSLRVLLVVLILSGLGSEAVDRLDIRRLGDLGLAELDEVVLVGVIAMAEALVGAAVLWLTQRRFGTGRSADAMATLLAASAIGIAVLGLVAVLPVAAAGLVVQGGLRQAAAPFATAWANANAPSTVRATVHSFVEQANSVGEITGGVLLGLVAAASTVPTAMAVSALLMLGAATAATRDRGDPGPSGAIELR